MAHQLLICTGSLNKQALNYKFCPFRSFSSICVWSPWSLWRISSIETAYVKGFWKWDVFCKAFSITLRQRNIRCKGLARNLTKTLFIGAFFLSGTIMKSAVLEKHPCTVHVMVFWQEMKYSMFYISFLLQILQFLSTHVSNLYNLNFSVSFSGSHPLHIISKK